MPMSTFLDCLPTLASFTTFSFRSVRHVQPTVASTNFKSRKGIFEKYGQKVCIALNINRNIRNINGIEERRRPMAMLQLQIAILLSSLVLTRSYKLYVQ